MTTANNAASFFSLLRTWGPTMMEEAARLKKEVVEHPIPLSSGKCDAGPAPSGEFSKFTVFVDNLISLTIIAPFFLSNSKK